MILFSYQIWRDTPLCHTVFAVLACARWLSPSCSVYLSLSLKHTVSHHAHSRARAGSLSWTQKNHATKEMHWRSNPAPPVRRTCPSFPNTKRLYTNSPSLSLALVNARYPRSNGDALDMSISVRAIASSEGDPPQEIQWIPVRVPWPWWRSDLTKCINWMVLESQLPHKIVNVLFTITNQNNMLTILLEGLTF